MVFKYKAKQTSLQTKIPEKLTTMKTLRETYIDLIYMENRKRQYLMSKLGAWGPWERVEWQGGEQRKMHSSIKSI